MTLTEEQKIEYSRKGRIFIRNALKANERVIKLEIEKSELTKMVHDTMPKTPNGVCFCNLCNVQSMVPAGYRNHTGTRNRDVSQPIYVCEICGYADIKSVSQFY